MGEGRNTGGGWEYRDEMARRRGADRVMRRGESKRRLAFGEHALAAEVSECHVAR